MSATHRCPRLVIAGTNSGVGKTTVMVALGRALTARGLRVATFKCGPDYLDPTYHARAVGTKSQTLDGWMMGRDSVCATFLEATRDSDIALIEGVMGLFDGASPTSDQGSTAEIAKWLQAPVLLVVDAGGMARSFAAVIHGFDSFDRDLPIAAAIANRVGSRGHLDLLRQALTSPLVLGGLPRDSEHAFSGRHLGLHTADDQVLPGALMDHWSAQAEAWLPIEELLKLARCAPEMMSDRTSPSDAQRPQKARCRIGIAHDEAFHFYYPDNLRRLEQAGAELIRFSPLKDEALPPVDGVYLGGGYPELHAGKLAQNRSMQRAIAQFAARGAPVYAECGGLMYLTRAIVTLTGERHEMVGLLPFEARMFARLQALGYVEVQTRSPSILGPANTYFRGHQFRYSELTPVGPSESVEQVYTVSRKRGGEPASEGYRLDNVIASYVHAHWASSPDIATALVDSCVRWRSDAAERPGGVSAASTLR